MQESPKEDSLDSIYNVDKLYESIIGKQKGKERHKRAKTKDTKKTYSSPILNEHIKELWIPSKLFIKEFVIKYAQTPLHLAAQHPKGASCINILLQSFESDKESTSLEQVKKEDFIEERDMNGRTALHLACKDGYILNVLELLNHNADSSAKDVHGVRPLHLACHYGRLNIVKKWIELLGTITIGLKDNYLWTELHYACIYGHTEVVSFLLDHESKLTPNQDLCTPLHFAAMTGRSDIVNILLKYTDNIDVRNSDGFTPLYFAAANGYTDLIEIFIANGANPDARDSKSEWCPLHVAARYGHRKTIVKLISYTKDIMTRDKSNCTPLHIASQVGETEVAICLIENNADVNARTNNNITPLHLACYNGEYDTVYALLDRGADVNYPSKSKFTPLHLASMCGHKDVVTILIMHGACVESRDKLRRTPIDVAGEGGENVDTKRKKDIKTTIKFVNSLFSPSENLSH